MSSTSASRPRMPVDGVRQETAVDKENDELCVDAVGLGMAPRFSLKSALMKLTMEIEVAWRRCRGYGMAPLSRQQW